MKYILLGSLTIIKKQIKLGNRILKALKTYLNVKKHNLTCIGITKVTKREIYLQCKCDCGKEKAIRSNHFGRIKSCGCYKKGRTPLEEGKAALNNYYTQYRLSAKKRGINFNLTIEDFKRFINSECYYCGIKPKKNYGRMFEKNTGTLIANGIDRSNNNLGYTVKNCVACCKICNRAKNNLDKNEFLLWIKKLKDCYGSENVTN